MTVVSAEVDIDEITAEVIFRASDRLLNSGKSRIEAFRELSSIFTRLNDPGVVEHLMRMANERVEAAKQELVDAQDVRAMLTHLD